MCTWPPATRALATLYGNGEGRDRRFIRNWKPRAYQRSPKPRLPEVVAPRRARNLPRLVLPRPFFIGASPHPGPRCRLNPIHIHRPRLLIVAPPSLLLLLLLFLLQRLPPLLPPRHMRVKLAVVSRWEAMKIGETTPLRETKGHEERRRTLESSPAL